MGQPVGNDFDCAIRRLACHGTVYGQWLGLSRVPTSSNRPSHLAGTQLIRLTQEMFGIP